MRGINVGGRQAIAMSDLRAILGELGYGGVQTLLNSGNAVFDAADATGTDIARRIETAIRHRLALEVRVVVRDLAELARIVADDPIPGGRDEPSRYVVSFLAGPIPVERRNRFDPNAHEYEAIHLGEGVVYIWYRDGIGRSKLTNDVLERQLGVVATARNWNTVTKVLALASR